MTVDIVVRPIDVSEAAAFRSVMGEAFGFDPKEEEQERFERLLEFDRSVAAFDGATMVGTAAAFTLGMTVPGAVVPTAGTSMITVSPTHRRRGVLREMMRAHLADVHARGEPLAALWASESVIYGRFGYGPAVEMEHVTVERAHAHFREPPPGGRVALLPPGEALAPLREVYDRAAPRRPGMLNRSEEWWELHHLHDPEHWREGRSAQRFAIYYEGTEALGYARYRRKNEWVEGHGTGTVYVIELVGLTPAARAGLWQFLFGLDLASRVDVWNQPVDGELRWLLSDQRRAQAVRRSDSLWVLVMDVEAALSARRYAAPGRVVLDVRNPFRPEAAGRFLLEADDDGTGRCAPTEWEPDISLDVADLGSAYLGGIRLTTLAAAGRVGGEATALRRADRMLSWDPLPWCPEIF